jgi:hypothetical protein
MITSAHPKPIEANISHPSASHLYISLMLLVGGVMQSYANGTPDALLVASFLLLAGLAVVNLIFQNRRPERRAFLSTYAACIFVGGLAQCYSLAVFNNPQSTPDALHSFFPLISAQPPFATMESLPFHNSPLAIVAWQQFYELAWWLGLEFGPYTGVMLNAFVMGLVASLTVRTARELFGNDGRRLRLVGILFAFNGLFILFGAVLIRDCFTTALNALVIWGIVRWLVRPTLGNLLLFATLTGISAYAMVYLRAQAVVLFGMYALLAFLFWVLAKRLNETRLMAALVAVGLLVIATPYLLTYSQLSQETQASGRENYAKQGANASASDSLGMRLVVNQPLPVRLVIGSGALLIYPLPLWTYFNVGATDYNWIKGYNGLYQLFLVPLVAAGFSAVFRQVIKDREAAIPLLFLAAYLLINMAAVVATSMEQRHFGQFMPAFMILAAFPDTRDKTARKRLWTISEWWLTVVVLVHLAWLFLKG